MNIYHKLLAVRNGFLTANATKSGKNTYAGYSYFELKDIVPVIEPLCRENGIIPIVTYTAEQAALTLVNADAPEETIVFTSPMAEASLKGAHAIQNMGAVQTYLRRYLYLTAFDIVEADALDATQGKKQSKGEKQANDDNPKITESQLKTIGGLVTQAAKAYNNAENKVYATIEKNFGKKLTEMTAKQGIEVCRWLSEQIQKAQQPTQ